MDLKQPLSATEFEELTEFLGSVYVPPDAMDICTLHGYLTSIAVGPVSLLPSHWYPRIWGQGQEPVFDSFEHAQRILNLLTRFSNQIILTLMYKPEKFLPALYNNVEKGKPRVTVEEWCTGFSLGVQLRPEAWQPLFKDEQNSSFLAPIIAFSLKGVWKNAPKGRGRILLRKQLIALLPQAVRAIYAHWGPARAQRTPGLVPDTLHLGGSRESPCPCGSGRKFNNCCGRPRRIS